jgi:membrane fusion protein, copper/silver efflux system
LTRIGWIVVATALLAGTGGWIVRGINSEPVSTGTNTSHAGHDHDAISHYTCPMHPSVKATEPGACPICGMDLTPVPKAGSQSRSTDKEGVAFIHLTSDQQQLIGVTMDTVARQAAHLDVRAMGRVVFDETRLTDVNLKVSGWIQDLHVDYVGKPVRKGEPLFTLYSPDLVSSQEEYLLAYRGLNRVTEYAGTSRSQVTGSSVWSETLLTSARERLELWDLTTQQILELETIGKHSTTVTVYAPSDGIVMERMAVAGMFVKPGMRLYRIARLDSVWIKVDVYEQDVPSVRVGQSAEISLPNRPGMTFEGSVDYVYPYLDPKTRTVTVRIRAANPDDVLRPDTFADVVLRQSEETRLIVPEAAVLFSGKRRTVFVALGDGRFQPRAVSLGRKFQSGYEIISGLGSGDSVVTSANFLLDSESKLQNVVAGMH